MEFQHPRDDQACAGVLPALRAALQRIETFLNDHTEDGRHRRQACDELRRVRGALLMLQAEGCAAVVGEMEGALHAAPPAAMAGALRDGLLRAFQEVRACIDPLDARLRPLTDLDHMTRELQALCAHDHGVAVAERPAAPAEAADDADAPGLAADPDGACGEEPEDGQDEALQRLVEELDAPAAADPVVVTMEDVQAELPADQAGGDGAPGEGAFLCGEWEPGGAAWESDAVELDGGHMIQIKAPLKTVVQTLPQWWDDMLNPVLLQTLDEAFGDIEARAGQAGLGEMGELALTLRRLVAKINDEMLPMTLQMMYGVIEQGVLKLGILLRDGNGAGGGPQVAGAATLVEAYSELRQLTHHVAAMDEDRPGRSARDELGHGVPAGAAPQGLDRLEDLLIEANLLHSQLLPRVNMMKQQQRHIQAELAALRRGGVIDGEDAGLDEAPEGTFAGMLRAHGALTRLIAECESCLQRYRDAAHQLRQAILADAGAGWRQAASQ